MISYENQVNRVYRDINNMHFMLSLQLPENKIDKGYYIVIVIKKYSICLLDKSDLEVSQS